MSDDRSIHLDARALRVLAHPLRSRLLTELRLHGAATATELAARLETNTGATSYHLRKLETVGLVTDTGAGEGKRRVWQAASRGHDWTPSEVLGDEDAEASLTWLTRHYLAQLGDRADQWLAVERDWPQAWRDALGYGDDAVTVTPAQATALQGELHALLRRYRNAGAGDPEARQVLVSAVMVPIRARHDEGRP